MVHEYVKGQAVQLSEHFRSTDFDCLCSYPDCTKTLVDTDLVYGLEQLYPAMPSMAFNSAYRCSKHNDEVGGIAGDSHTKGRAVDVRCEGYDGNDISAFAGLVPLFKYGGIGTADEWSHLDCRKDGPHRWTYPPGK